MAVISVGCSAIANSSAPYIAPYYNDKQGAISFTFDDGFQHEVDDALEIIDPLGIKGTFFLIPTRVDTIPSQSIHWDQAKSMVEHGHELGTHDAIKPRLHEIPIEQVVQKINGGGRLIEQNTGQQSVSFAMPGGSKNNPEIEAIIYEQHYFFRKSEKLPNAIKAGYGSAGKRVWDDHKTRAQIEESVSQGKWFIPVIHSVVNGYSPFKSKEEFKAHCEWVVSKEHVIWIAPLGEVGRYVYERDAATLDVTSQTSNSLTFKLTHTLQDKAVFNHPLTVVIPETGAVSAKATDASGQSLETSVKDGKILVNALPNGQTVAVTW